MDGEEALARLVSGNDRYMAGASVNEGRDAARRAGTVQSQSPFAVILSCSDSRVPSEVVFDEGIGDLFVVRVAGNTAQTPIVQGSIEFAVHQLRSVLLMVLGHEGCGAVKAALDRLAGSPPPAGRITAFVDPILPAARMVQHFPQDQQMTAAVVQNVANQAGALKALQPVLRPAIAEGRLKLVEAMYLLESGKVELLT